MWTGYFNQHRRPCLNIKINSAFFPAIIDTGFDGFVQIDLQLAVTLGWVKPKMDIGISQIADGKSMLIGLFDSSVMIESDTVTGI